MNDLDYLRTHGPEPTSLTTDVLDRARAALQQEIEHRPNAAQTVTSFRPRRRIHRRTVGFGVAAAALAGLAVLTPSLLGTTNAGAIALVPVRPMTFPVTPTQVPEGLAHPVFDRDINFTMAQYRGPKTGSASSFPRPSTTGTSPTTPAMWVSTARTPACSLVRIRRSSSRGPSPTVRSSG